MGGPASSYSDAEVEAIAGWLREGLSGSQIAGALSTMRGTEVSRNAIIGVVHRNKTLAAIGFKTQGRTRGQRKPKVDRPSRPGKNRFAWGSECGQPARAVPTRTIAPMAAQPVRQVAEKPVRRALAVPSKLLADLAWNECRWPVNNARPGEDHLFCASSHEGLGPYCPKHAARAIGRGSAAERAAPRVLDRAMR